MTGAEYIAKYLAKNGTTDAFGIPGGVILDLLYAMDAQDGITPHLSYHEQAAGFAACGYAQASGRLGVAYATRGPGFTNLVTAIADAYFDSAPVLFLAAHSSCCPPDGMRVLHDQEIDTCGMVRKITKYAARIDSSEELLRCFPAACQAALSGRMGSVFLDVAAGVLHEDVRGMDVIIKEPEVDDADVGMLADEITDEIRQAHRPVLLIGDGINQAKVSADFRALLAKTGVPCVSSRFSHNVACCCDGYFGYVGSHAIREANFILSKADLIVSLGNRLNFPVNSFSFSNVVGRARFLRYDIDQAEFKRQLPNSICRRCNIASLLACLADEDRDFGDHSDWMRVCEKLREQLSGEDKNEIVERISRIMAAIPYDATVVSDVGNHEFFVSRAAVLCKLPCHVLYSKSFGAMGSALGRSIGAYYARHKPVVCFVGDQGIQLNIQELQYISMHRLPITVVLINNGVSGMIRDKERSTRYKRFLHVSKDTGFAIPDMPMLFKSYGIDCESVSQFMQDGVKSLAPLFVDCIVDGDVELAPTLPHNNYCQEMYPSILPDKYQGLNKL